MVLEPEIVEIPTPALTDVITEDDTPVGSIFSEKQQRLLADSLYTSWAGPGDERPFIALANVGLFYRVDRPAIVPDVLVSLDVTLPEEVWEKRHRSYFVWEYGKPPDVVIEVVSNRKGEELGEKLRRYARIGIAYYIVFDPEEQLGDRTLSVFGRRYLGYVEREDLWLPEVELGLTLWNGVYQGLDATWLRWLDREGRLILTGAEATVEARQQAEQERLRAEHEHQRAERLAAQLQNARPLSRVTLSQ